MNIDKFKTQHLKIFECINKLRHYALSGVPEHAQEIAQSVVSMSSLIKLHLSVEDSVLYPALRMSKDQEMVRLGNQYQDEMKVIATSYDVFARRWNTAANVAKDPNGFRAEANVVLKKLHARICQEDSKFYPAIEAI